jgi:hypothetical protein
MAGFALAGAAVKTLERIAFRGKSITGRYLMVYGCSIGATIRLAFGPIICF